MVKGIENHPSSSFDSPGHLDNQIDAFTSGQYSRILCQHRKPLCDCCFGFPSGGYSTPRHDPGLAKCPFAMLGRPIGNPRESNPRYGRGQVQSDRAA